MKITRRDAIKLGLISSGAFFLPLGSTRSVLAAPFSPRIARFVEPLPIPPVLPPDYSDKTTDYYAIALKKARISLVPGTTTEIWGYNGRLPGPTIRQRGGDEQEGGRQSVVRFINQLGEDQSGGEINAVVHLHGMASLPQYDGFATDFIKPGQFKDYIYPNDRAATIWYHDHAIDHTARNVYQGLAGMYIVEDELERQLPLPKGPYDVPLILRDAFFEVNPLNGEDLQLVFDDRQMRSTYGDVSLVNGIPWPKMQVERRKYRFRLLNASASRSFQLALSQQENRLTVGETMVVIGSDGGLLATPVELKTPYQTLRIDMAERYEIIIDFCRYEEGDCLFLKNIGFSGSIDIDDRIHTLMCFEVVGGEVPDDSQIPETLRPVERLPEKTADRTRTFRFERSFNRWLINGKQWDENRVDANPGVGDIEIWEFFNPGSGWFHPVHVHLIDMQVLDRNGLPPRPYEMGWKDVFHVGEFQVVRVIGEFGPRRKGYKRRFIQGKFMMHCHNLVHEDHSMMTVFEVGQNGPSPKSAPAQDIAQMSPFKVAYPTPPNPYDREAIEEFDRELYGTGR
ncbi:multicopper oxidase family protein [Lyngbya confervoides]|uniref:Multicopper oxidase domain-containing protein n=1 Tax=Lyngbya confervoides BDU141951 TaxID=1574623 RepID=A0ABD4T2F3_9CYAN|nr:multicopper oxidase domain-containing protein [Lyngbya confervoides]MCM1982620.1 multicopper oxidase domain-containing protein [Lyngbya confervoides BDU141951]